MIRKDKEKGPAVIKGIRSDANDIETFRSMCIQRDRVEIQETVIEKDIIGGVIPIIHEEG